MKRFYLSACVGFMLLAVATSYADDLDVGGLYGIQEGSAVSSSGVVTGGLMTEGAWGGTCPNGGGMVFDASGLYGCAPNSDVAPKDLLIHASHEFDQGTQTAANLLLAGGIAPKVFESTAFANSTGDELTIVVGNCASGVCAIATTTLTESTHWDCDVTSDNVCACALYTYLTANLPTGIDSVSRTDATCTDSKVFLQPSDSGTYSVVIAVQDTGGGGVWGTATNGTDGALVVPGGSVNGGICWAEDLDGTNTCVYRSNTDQWAWSTNGIQRMRLSTNELAMSLRINMAGKKLFDSTRSTQYDAACTDANSIGTGGGCHAGEVQITDTLYANGGVTMEAGDHLLFAVDNDATTPSIQLEPGTGFYSRLDDQLSVATNGVEQWRWSGSIFIGVVSGGPFMLNVDATDTVPNIGPDDDDQDTGVGTFNLDSLSLIAGGVELVRLTQNDAAVDTVDISGHLSIGSGTKHDGHVFTDAAEVQTTDATVTVLETLTLLDENTYHVEALVVGVKSDGSDRASYHIIATVYRTGAGSATIQGVATTVHTAESNAAWDADFTVSGSDVRVSVTGVAATTIEWGSTLTHINMSN